MYIYSYGKLRGKTAKDGEWTCDIIITFAPTSFTASKIALAVPGTPAIPVLQKETMRKTSVSNFEGLA